MEARKKSKFVLFEELDFVTREEKLRIIEKVKIIPQAVKADFSVFSEDQIVLPVDDGEPRDRFHLLEETFDVALPRLLALQAKYPPGSYITIGESSAPELRDKQYNSKAEFYRRDFFQPKLKMEEQILYRSNNKFNALMVEYLLQYHLSEGFWMEQFSALANPQKKLFAYLWHYKSEPHYVYAKFSTKKANFSLKPIAEDDDDDDNIAKPKNVVRKRPASKQKDPATSSSSSSKSSAKKAKTTQWLADLDSDDE